MMNPKLNKDLAPIAASAAEIPQTKFKPQLMLNQESSLPLPNLDDA